MSPLLKAIAVGIGVFVIVMVLFWTISKIAGRPFLTLPRRPAPAPTVPSPTIPPFLR